MLQFRPNKQRVDKKPLYGKDMILSFYFWKKKCKSDIYFWNLTSETPTLFTIKLHHGGEFTRFPNVNYINGTISYSDTVDINAFFVHQLDIMMKGLGYVAP